MTAPTTPCGESRWGSYHRSGTFVQILDKTLMAVKAKKLDTSNLLAETCRTTHPSQGHSVGFCLGRKNRLLGGFSISAAREKP